ncbi:MAG: S49 family peptidase [Hyphomicrobium sp.]|jgi:signal peptide peptidase SppA|nr:S49 family peptidase [Hyphomicrobium sp.]
MWPFSRKSVVPVLRFSGPIGMVTPLRPGLAISGVASSIEKAFNLSKLPSVAVVINSPGGSPVQSNLIFKRIRQFAEEKNKKVYVFCEDVAASGGYFLAISGDEIYADPSSIVGSIGVISASFGFVEAIEKLGIERRVYTSGLSKSTLDPFLPEKPEDVARLQAIQRDVHDVFIGLVKERRAGKLRAPDAELFSGAFWSGPKAAELGLIDGIADVRTKMQEIHGSEIRLQVVEPAKPGLLGRLRRMTPNVGGGVMGRDAPAHLSLAFADDLVSAMETRAMWSRYGL